MEDPQFISIGDYVPGVCNIGPDEIRKRKQSFYMAAVGGIIIAALFWLSSLSPVLYIIGILVLFGAGIGFGVTYFQWADKFCVAFGMMGVFNFGNTSSRSDTAKRIEDQDAKAKDKAKVRWMFTKSVFVSLFYTIVVVLIGSWINFPILINI